MKKRYFVLYALLIIMVLVFESSFFARIPLGTAQPDLILVISIVLIFFLPLEQLMICILIGGVLEDFFIGRMIGSQTLALALNVFLIKKVTGRIINENILIPLVVVFLGSIVHGCLMVVIMYLTGNGAIVNLLFMKNILFSSLYNTLLTIIVYPIAYLVFHRFQKEQV